MNISTSLQESLPDSKEKPGLPYWHSLKGDKAVQPSECPGNQYYLQGQAAQGSHLSSLINCRPAPQTLSKWREHVPELPFDLKRLELHE